MMPSKTKKLVVTKKVKPEESLGSLVDKLYQLKLEKSEISAKEAEIKQKISELEDTILNRFSKDELSGASGKLAKLSVTQKLCPNIEDWDAFYEYIARENAWDLLQRRVSSTAYQARVEEGVEVPGTTKFVKLVLNTKKAK